MGTPKRHGALLAVLLGALGLAVPLPAAFAAPAGNWHVASTLSLGTGDTSIACPSPTLCTAIEAGELLASADGGETWISETATVPSDVAALHDVDCPSITRCYLTATGADGSALVLAERGGRLAEHGVGGAGTLVAISCPSTRRCVATDGSRLYVSTDGAASWDPRPLPAILSPSPDVACVRMTTVCTIVGDRGETPVVERTKNLGTTWVQESAPSPSDGLYTVACPSPSTCYAGGSTFSDNAEVIVTTNHGKTWSFASVPSQGYPVRSISCATVMACWALGQAPGRAPFVFMTTDGQHFDAQAMPVVATEQSAELACPSTTRCAAVAGAVGFVTDDGGAHWNQLGLPAAVEAPITLSCPKPNECVAGANDAFGRASALTSADGGETWTPHALPAGTGSFIALDCPTTAVCIALATSGAPGSNQLGVQALRSADGGVTWKRGAVADRRGQLGWLSCASPTSCLAAGFDNRSNAKLEVTTDGGAHWSPIAAPDNLFTIEGLGCSAGGCVVIAGNPNEAPQAFTTTNLGASFDAHPIPYADGVNVHFNDVDCNDRTCVAVGEYYGDGVIMRSRDVGATWTASKVPRAAQLVARVSCGTPTFCAAASFDYRPRGGPVIVESTTSGRAWRAFHVPARQEQPLDVACHARGCIASDSSTAGNPIILAGDF